MKAAGILYILYWMLYQYIFIRCLIVVSRDTTWCCAAHLVDVV
jgi:hypothetical protein